MNLLAVISRQKRRLEKRIGKLQGELVRMNEIARLLGQSNHIRHKVSAAARHSMSLAQKRRWAKVRASKGS